ncbi:MAG: hypothetical protein ABW023_13710 [Sphingomonas sp.]
MAPPNLKDPVERAAYRRELAGVAWGIRLAGIGLAALGAVLVALQRRELLAVPLWLAFTVVGAGLMLMITAIAARTRYHALRMRG